MSLHASGPRIPATQPQALWHPGKRDHDTHSPSLLTLAQGSHSEVTTQPRTGSPPVLPLHHPGRGRLAIQTRWQQVTPLFPPKPN